MIGLKRTVDPMKPGFVFVEFVSADCICETSVVIRLDETVLVESETSPTPVIRRTPEGESVEVTEQFITFVGRNVENQSGSGIDCKRGKG